MQAEDSIVPCVGIVCFRGDDVLLIKRGKPPKLGEWSIPGGRIEFGESAEAAALRELEEETSVKAKLRGLADVVDGLFTQNAPGKMTSHYLLCDYAAQWISGDPQAASDALHAEFIPPDRLRSLDLWEETLRVIEIARRLVAEKAA